MNVNRLTKRTATTNSDHDHDNEVLFVEASGVGRSSNGDTGLATVSLSSCIDSISSPKKIRTKRRKFDNDDDDRVYNDRSYHSQTAAAATLTTRAVKTEIVTTTATAAARRKILSSTSSTSTTTKREIIDLYNDGDDDGDVNTAKTTEKKWIQPSITIDLTFNTDDEGNDDDHVDNNNVTRHDEALVIAVDTFNKKEKKDPPHIYATKTISSDTNSSNTLSCLNMKKASETKQDVQIQQDNKRPQVVQDGRQSISCGAHAGLKSGSSNISMPPATPSASPFSSSSSSSSLNATGIQ